MLAGGCGSNKTTGVVEELQPDASSVATDASTNESPEASSGSLASSGTDSGAPSGVDSGAASDGGSTGAECPTKSTSSTAQPMPVISRGVPAYASSAQSQGSAADGNSADYEVYWQSASQPISSAAPAWLAYDLSSVPVCQRGKVLVSWYQPVGYDAFDPYDFTIPTSYDPAMDSTGNGQYGLPMNYVLEGNAAPGGGSAPASGWVALLPSAVANNVYHARTHLVDLTGYDWIRMRVTAVTDSATTPETPVSSPSQDVAFKLDVQDASLGADDSWLFLGDSITSHCMSNVEGGTNGADKTFSELVNASKASFFPAVVNGGMGGSKTITNPAPQVAGDAVNSIDAWLAMFPGKFVGLSWGTNDVNGDAWGIDPSIAAYKTLVNKVIAAGKVPVVPHMPWAPASGVSGATDASSGAPYAPMSPGAAYNAQIDSQIYTIAGVVRGPDLWSVFENQDVLVPRIRRTCTRTTRASRCTGRPGPPRCCRPCIRTEAIG